MSNADSSVEIPVHAAAPLERCAVPTMRRLLFVYGLNRASPAERNAFEVHVRSCAACFGDLVAMHRAAELIDEWIRRPDEAPDGVSSLVRAGRLRRWTIVAIAVAVAAALGFLFRTAL